MEQVARERAVAGSDTLLIFLLKSKAKVTKTDRKRTMHTMATPKLPHETSGFFQNKVKESMARTKKDTTEKMEGVIENPNK